MKPRGSENLITVICEPFAYLKEPLAERLPNLGQKPITFMYGDYDWMERESAENLVKAGKVQGKVFNVEDAGHHLYIQNPVKCVANLLSQTHGQAIADAFSKSHPKQAQNPSIQ